MTIPNKKASVVSTWFKEHAVTLITSLGAGAIALVITWHEIDAQVASNSKDISANQVRITRIERDLKDIDVKLHALDKKQAVIVEQTKQTHSLLRSVLEEQRRTRRLLDGR